MDENSASEGSQTKQGLSTSLYDARRASKGKVEVRTSDHDVLELADEEEGDTGSSNDVLVRSPHLHNPIHAVPRSIK